MQAIQHIQDTGEFLYLRGTSSPKKSIYAFDLDGTLTTYKNCLNPARYTDDSNNWHFLGPVKQKILELNSHFTIFIITNQLNVTSGKIGMIEQVYRELDGIPHILAANRKNAFRKPQKAFMNIIQQIVGTELDLSNSYYCGDAVSIDDPFPPYRRTPKGSNMGDDLQFAMNAHLNFIRPCDLFEQFSFQVTHNYINKYSLIMMMGSPASGKSSCAKFLETHYGYVRFSQDECGDLKKKVHIIESTLENKCVVLDATFASHSNRHIWLTLASKMNKSICIIWCIRDGRVFNSLREKPVSHFAYDGPYGYVKNFNDPTERVSDVNYDLVKLY